jgi:hypothetical protein
VILLNRLGMMPFVETDAMVFSLTPPDNPVIADTDQQQPRVSVAQRGDALGDRVSHLLLVLNRRRLCTYLLYPGTDPLDRDVGRGGIEQGLNRWQPLIILCDRHSGIDIAFVTAQP